MKNTLAVLALCLSCATVAHSDQTVTTGASAGQNILIADPGKISTSGAVTIQSGATAVFAGGTSVTLLPGFQVVNGAQFRATRDSNSANLASLVDTDFDGLPDAWEILHFGNLSATGAQDSDGDGVSNLAEYFAGTNPNLNETTAARPVGVQVVVKTPRGKFQGVTSSWNIVPVP